MDEIPNLIILDKGDGRLSEIDTQLDLIDRLLVDADFDIITDFEGNLLSE